MGGIGSGSYRKVKSKATTEDFFSLDISKLSKLVPITANCKFTLVWRYLDKTKDLMDCLIIDGILELSYLNNEGMRDVFERIKLISTKCNFGGERIWFACPGCNKKARILYWENKFRCRKCLNIYHPSSNEGKLFRATRALCNYQNKLNGKDSTPLDGISFLSKPKWMRHKTYYKLHEESLNRTQVFYNYYLQAFSEVGRNQDSLIDCQKKNRS